MHIPHLSANADIFPPLLRGKTRFNVIKFKKVTQPLMSKASIRAKGQGRILCAPALNKFCFLIIYNVQYNI